MVKLVSKDGTVSNIEAIMNYCSELGRIFGYPYFFNWSVPTNRREDSTAGEVSDVDYVIFRVGKYPQHPEVSRFSPVEKVTVFSQVRMIVENHVGLQSFAEEKGLKLASLDSICDNLGTLKAQIDDFLGEDLIKGTNRRIDAYNKEYPNQIPVGIVVSVNEVRRVKDYLIGINLADLGNITWIEDGKVCDIPDAKETIARWKYTGLNNTDFVSSGCYKHGIPENLDE